MFRTGLNIEDNRFLRVQMWKRFKSWERDALPDT